MTTIAYSTPAQSNLLGGDRVRAWSWALANGDVGQAVEAAVLAQATVQITGTFGAGGTIVLEGSNDGVTYVTLHDPATNSLSFTAAGMKAILECCRFIRPKCTAGDGTTALVATVVGSV